MKNWEDEFNKTLLAQKGDEIMIEDMKFFIRTLLEEYEEY